MTTRKIKIGTRGSKLALWQANYFADLLRSQAIESEIHIIKTKGDIIKLSFNKIEGKGFFTSELESALVKESIDVAVHSMKDLPSEYPEELTIAAIPTREDPSDCLLIHPHAVEESRLFKMKKGAKVGTSSARRKAQLTHFRADIRLQDIRGNVPTRIQKLLNGEFDAIVLAKAGINRIQPDLKDLLQLKFHPTEFIPAPGQGALAFQCRKNDLGLISILSKLIDEKSTMAVNIERRVMQLIGGGCHAPLGVYCQIDKQQYYHVWACFTNKWNQPLKKTKLSLSTKTGLAEEIVNQLKS